MSRRLCALTLARQARPVCHGACGARGLVSASWAPLCAVWLMCNCFGSLGPRLCLGACVHFPSRPGPTLCIVGLVLLLFRLTSLHSLLQGLGVFLLAPQTQPLCREVCVHCRGLYASPLSAPRPTLCTVSVVYTSRVCMPGHSRTSGPTLCTTRAVCTGGVCMLPQRAMCALERFVSLPSLGAPSPLLGREHSPCLFSAL